MLTAIIVAGGSSRRMGIDKTFALLGGRPIIAHSLLAFEAAESVDEITVVGRADRLPELRKVVANLSLRKVCEVIAGGTHRQDSVQQGLLRVSEAAQFVAVHDAARPLITPAEIERVFEAARTHGAASLAGPVADTLKRADEHRVVCGSVDREGLYAMQTPQIFARDMLIKAYAQVTAAKASITDEVSAVEMLGRKVVLVPNEEYNFKITYPADLQLAELVLSGRASTTR